MALSGKAKYKAEIFDSVGCLFGSIILFNSFCRAVNLEIYNG